MQPFRIILVVFVLLVNLLIVPASWADPPKLTTTPEYTEVTQAIDALLNAKASPDEAGLTAAEIEQQLGQLNLQKYILETAREWSQCHNKTGKTIAVYTHKAKKNQPSNLYYLGNGQITDDDWNCDGIYLPAGTPVAGVMEQATEPLALQIVSGTQLVAKTAPTGALELNITPSKILKAGEGSLALPNLSTAAIAATPPNAPIED